MVKRFIGVEARSTRHAKARPYLRLDDVFVFNNRFSQISPTVSTSNTLTFADVLPGDDLGHVVFSLAGTALE